MYPPQYTGRVGYSPTNQQNPQYNCRFQAGLETPGGNGPPGDNGDVDGDGRDDKNRKGKNSARRHRMPWDDSSEGESPPPPPPSSPSSSSKDSSPTPMDRSFLDKDALRWYNDEVTGLHRSQLNWTFEKVILGLFARFVQATTIHVAAEKFEATEYDPEKGVRAKKFLDGLPTSIISEMIERRVSPNLATLSKMVKTVEHLEDNKALKIFYLKSKTSVEEPDDFRYKSDVEWHTQEEIVGHHWDGDNLVFHTEWNTDEGCWGSWKGSNSSSR
ncbi:hypothetical protein BT96DRAFT_1009508 [Gymnopus androsaceus JB14]|uniref:Uncharacterized protein n=1 Tax=Gymnopus androsaceus JB14 TaxID=1447944 RepID=A0A6A4GCS5_9AGAR|nr:hypothetical protein BT96DRAFT_1009508 [Gymnopus androsaceus JB14]